MNYSETLEYLFAQLPMYHRIGAAAYKTDLDNTIAICSYLQNPQNSFKTIHVAGTNGKGSVSHLLASVFQENGFKTGLYTSPHLKDFRERIRVNGKMISKKYVVEFVKCHFKEFEKIQPSFFEWTVGLAFDYFRKQKVDIAIIETGLGGRLDSTNIITPELSVITNISFDHTNLLGNSIQKIAFEKAGIIKANTSVVIGRYQKEAADVYATKAAKEKSEIVYAAELVKFSEYHQIYAKQPLLKLKLQAQSKNLFFRNKEVFYSQLTGLYQTENIATVLACIDTLNRYGILLDKRAIKAGIKNVVQNTGIRGRWEILSQNPLTVCDTGHNEEGIKFLLNQVNALDFNKLHFVFGTVNDKEIDTILNLLPKNAVYYFCQANIPRALNADLLAEKALSKGLYGNTFSTVKSAFDKAKKDANIDDLILVGGSNFVVAEVI